MITTTITQEDIDKALSEYKDTCQDGVGNNISCCCLVYQVLKRNGYPVQEVGYSLWFREPKSGVAQSHPLDASAIRLTYLSSHDWPAQLGKEVILL